MPEPVLEPVDQAKEERRGERRRDPDEGRDPDEAQILRGRRGRLRRVIHRQPGYGRAPSRPSTPSRALEPSWDGTTGDR